MPVTLTTNSETKTVEIQIEGRVTSAEFDQLVPEFEAFIDANDKIRLLEVVHSLDGFDPSMIWKGLKLDLRVIPHITHCAVVSDLGWISPVSKAAGALVSTKLRTFTLAEIDAAHAWLADPES